MTRPLARVITILAALAAVAVALSPPVTYLFAAHSRVQGVLEAHARLFAAEISEAARQNPALWNALAGSALGAADTNHSYRYTFASGDNASTVERRVVISLM